MEKITNISQATDYVYAQLKEINPDIEKDDVYDTIMDEILESVEYTLTDDDVRFLEDNEKNLTAIDEYLASKIPDYKELLSDIVVDMVSDEIMDAE
ncbi:MAG TPA: hypothetical protein PKC87_02010 [Candidatus Absconditabacterales bacterium]|nr:hypothetical protein [Candidatus Absconditabacterales bacterium]